LQLTHAFKVNKNNEAQQLSFSATALNLLNQHSVIAYWQGLNSQFVPSSLGQYSIFNGAPFYQQFETGYDPQALMNAQAQECFTGAGFTCPVVQNSAYTHPNQWQISRSFRLAAKFTW
jgi:hypothetical protein